MKERNMKKVINNKKSVDTLVISDIHLGLELCRHEKVLKVLKEYDFKKLVLNGDIFDGLNFKRLHTGHWEILSRIREISRDKEVIWIVGNHDSQVAELSRLIGVKMRKEHLWEERNKKFCAIHGHQFDRFKHRNIILSGIAIFLYETVLKHEKSGRISHFFRDRSRRWLRLSDEVAKGAFGLAKWRKADIVICGHTHKPMREEKEGILYLNSGCFVDDPCSYIIVKDGKAELMEG